LASGCLSEKTRRRPTCDSQIIILPGLFSAGERPGDRPRRARWPARSGGDSEHPRKAKRPDEHLSKAGCVGRPGNAERSTSNAQWRIAPSSAAYYRPLISAPPPDVPCSDELKCWLGRSSSSVKVLTGQERLRRSRKTHLSPSELADMPADSSVMAP